ncbi:hypothetical protein MBLNU230_g0321t1 [Neophaeotheca triangularis]
MPRNNDAQNNNFDQYPIDSFPNQDDQYGPPPMAQGVSDDYVELPSKKNNKKFKADKTQQENPVEIKFEGWMLSKAPPQTVGQGLTWQRVGKRALPFDEAKLVSMVKAHRRRSKTTPIEDFRRLSSNQQGIINRIIADRKLRENHPNADWMLVDVQKEVDWKWTERQVKRLQIVLKRQDKLTAKAGIHSVPQGTGAYAFGEIVDLAEPARLPVEENNIPTKKEKKNGKKTKKYEDAGDVDVSNDPMVDVFPDGPHPPPRDPQPFPPQPEFQSDYQQPRFDNFGPDPFANQGPPPNAIPINVNLPPQQPQEHPFHPQPQHHDRPHPNQQQNFPDPRIPYENPFLPGPNVGGDYERLDTYDPFNPRDHRGRGQRTPSPSPRRHRRSHSRSRSRSRDDSRKRRDSKNKEARRLRKFENRMEEHLSKVDTMLADRLADLHVQNHHHNHSSDSSNYTGGDDDDVWSQSRHPLSSPPSTPPTSEPPRGSLHHRKTPRQQRYYHEPGARYDEGYEMQPGVSRPLRRKVPSRYQHRAAAGLQGYDDYSGGRPGFRRAETFDDYPHHHARYLHPHAERAPRMVTDFAEGYEEYFPGEEIGRQGRRRARGVDYTKQSARSRRPEFVAAERREGYGGAGRPRVYYD